MTVGAAVPPIVVLLAALFPRPIEEPGAEPPYLESLVQAERAFARRATEIGASAAFLEVLAEDAVVFNPGPVHGRELHTTRPWPREYVLEWHPRVAAVSAAGDLGYTSGPYVFRASPEAENAAYGHYFSVWRRESADGPWKLVLDMGTPHAPVGDEEDVISDVREFPEVEAAASAWPSDEAAGALRAAVERLHRVLDGGASGDLEGLALEAFGSTEPGWCRPSGSALWRSERGSRPRPPRGAGRFAAGGSAARRISEWCGVGGRSQMPILVQARSRPSQDKGAG